MRSSGRQGATLARPRALSSAVRAFRWRHSRPTERRVIDVKGSQWAEGRQLRGALRLVVSRNIKGDGSALRPFFPGALVEVRARRGLSGARAGLGLGLGGRAEGSGAERDQEWDPSAAARLWAWERWAPGRREGKGGDPPEPLFSWQVSARL